MTSNAVQDVTGNWIGSIKMSSQSYLGPVHTYADIFENGGFFLRFGVASTRKRRFRHAKTEVFENALQSGGFRKRRFRVYV